MNVQIQFSISLDKGMELDKAAYDIGIKSGNVLSKKIVSAVMNTMSEPQIKELIKEA